MTRRTAETLTAIVAGALVILLALVGYLGDIFLKALVFRYVLGVEP